MKKNNFPEQTFYTVWNLILQTVRHFFAAASNSWGKKSEYTKTAADVT